MPKKNFICWRGRTQCFMVQNSAFMYLLFSEWRTDPAKRNARMNATGLQISSFDKEQLIPSSDPIYIVEPCSLFVTATSSDHYR